MNEINFTVPQMETIKKTAEIFGLPVYFVRQKVTNGEIVAVKAGRKFLVNVEKFAEYLNSATLIQENKPCTAVSRIKPVI